MGGMAALCRVRFAPDLLPMGRIERRHMDVPFGREMHLGQLDSIGERQEQPENLRPADDRDGFSFARKRKRATDIMGDLGPCPMPLPSARQTRSEERSVGNKCGSRG